MLVPVFTESYTIKGYRTDCGYGYLLITATGRQVIFTNNQLSSYFKTDISRITHFHILLNIFNFLNSIFESQLHNFLSFHVLFK
jgi:hypothetical protein